MQSDGWEQPLSELTVPDALLLAVQLHRTGHLDEAQVLYERILDVVPDTPDALHFLGVLLHHRGKSDAALRLIEKSVSLDPNVPDWHNNLGNVLLEMGRLTEATDAYQQSIALDPGHADAYSNLGAVLNAQGRLEEARAAYHKAIELDPDHADAYNNLGNLSRRQGRIHEAVAHYCKALTLRPNCVESKKLLGIAYYSIGEIGAAADVFRRWLEEEPGHPIARHLLAACSGRDVPARASDAFIETTFDSFAASFDAKLEHLDYRAPGLIVEALAKVCPAPRKGLVALDAGCGTGLCGPLIAPYVRHLTGVDLSSAMLAKAQSRGAYDRLVKAELTAFLEGHAGVFDVIVSADTLVYFGSLAEVLEAGLRALKPGGLFIFTVEALLGDETGLGHRLSPHGRYSHRREYVREALSVAGFTVLSIEPSVLRTEGGSSVDGLVATALREVHEEKEVQ